MEPDRLDREDRPGPGPRPVDVARAEDRALDLAGGVRLQDDLLGGDLRVDVGVAVGADGVGLVDPVGEVGVAEGADGGEVDEALGARRERGVEHVAGPEHVGPPGDLAGGGVGDDRRGVDDDARSPRRRSCQGSGSLTSPATMPRLMSVARSIPRTSLPSRGAGRQPAADEAGGAGDQCRFHGAQPRRQRPSFRPPARKSRVADL